MEQLPDKRELRRHFSAGCLLFLALFLCVGAAIALIFGGASLVRRPPKLSPATPMVAATVPLPAPDRPVLTPDEVPAENGSLAAPVLPAAQGGRIAFVDRQGRLGTVSPDGSAGRLLTGDDARFLFPAWSPDGARLAAVGRTADGPGVFVVADDDGAAVAPLFVDPDGAPVYLYWSPGGNHVSFIAGHEDGLGLYVTPADEPGESRLLATGAPLYWEWRADGEEVLVHSGVGDADAHLAFVDVAGGVMGDNLAEPGYFQAPGISAGGRYLAWAEVDAAGARWLVVEDGASDEDRRLPHLGSVALNWSPSPERQHLAFVSPEPRAERALLGHYGPLRLLDAASGDVKVLTRQLVLAFFWAPDGRQIAYVTIGNDDEGFQAASPFSRRSRGKSQHGNVQLSLWLVDVEAATTNHLLSFRPTPLYLTQFLPFFDQYALSHRVWSPDGSALVLPVAGQGDEPGKIYVVPVDGSELHAVAEGDIAFWSP